MTVLTRSELEEITSIIFTVASRHGEPLTRDVAAHIAISLFGPATPVDCQPGDVARLHRERYEEP